MKVEIVGKSDFLSELKWWVLNIDGDEFGYAIFKKGDSVITQFRGHYLYTIVPMNEDNPKETVERFYKLLAIQ